MKHLASILIGIILLSACGNRNSGNNTANNNNNETVANADEWIGNYNFFEFIPPNVNMNYDLIVYKENEEFYAKVEIDGFQTWRRLQAKLQIDGNRASFVFDKYLYDNIFDDYEAGDVLLILERKEADILTFWGKITPIDKANKTDGEIYFTPSSQPVHDADWCELEDVILPQLNTSVIKGEYAVQINNEIKAIYNKLQKGYEEYLRDRIDDSGHGPEASYVWTVIDNILSVMIKYNGSGWSASIGSFKFINLNIQTGQQISPDELIQLAGITPENIKTAVEKANLVDLKGVYRYTDDYYYRTQNMYLDKNGLAIYLVYVLNEACENDPYLPLYITEWMNLKITDKTMDEAVDILAKKLGDSKLKYMPDEDETVAVNGEKTHYIQAYYESPDGESIATLGHFYIGYLSGKIYILDIIADNDIILYDEYLRKYNF